MAKSIEAKVAAYRELGYGPKTVARFERSLRETAEFGPLGFVQRDIGRIMDAITEGLPGGPLVASRQQGLMARATKAVADLASLPIEDARKAREAVKRIAETAGIPLP